MTFYYEMSKLEITIRGNIFIVQAFVGQNIHPFSAFIPTRVAGGAVYGQ